jgi:hypothetical protein
VLEQKQEKQVNYPARTVAEFHSNKKLQEEVFKDSIYLLLKGNDKTERLTQEELFMISNLEKKKTDAQLKFTLLIHIKRTDKRYFKLYHQVLNSTLCTIKEVNLSNEKIERIISLEELKALEKLDLSCNNIKRI